MEQPHGAFCIPDLHGTLLPESSKLSRVFRWAPLAKIMHRRLPDRDDYNTDLDKALGMLPPAPTDESS